MGSKDMIIKIWILLCMETICRKNHWNLLYVEAIFTKNVFFVIYILSTLRASNITKKSDAAYICYVRHEYKMYFHIASIKRTRCLSTYEACKKTRCK